MSADADETTIAGRLRVLRQQQGEAIGHPTMSETEFAKLLGVEAAGYRAAENGTSEPSMALLTALHHTTGISLDWLVMG